MGLALKVAKTTLKRKAMTTILTRCIVIFCAFFTLNIHAQTEVQKLDGDWYSTEWQYGYKLKDGIGTATSTNSPNFKVGQNIIQLSAISNTTFVGQQVYKDGKFYKVVANLTPEGRLRFEGEKNAKWTMERISSDNQKVATSSPTVNTSLPIPKKQNASPPIPDFEISAKDLINEFKANNFAATMKYKNKRVLVNGIVKDIAPTLFEKPESVKITLAETVKEWDTFNGVLVPSKEQIAEAVKIKKGDFTKLLCDGGVTYSMASVDGKGCQLTTANPTEQSEPIANIDALKFSISFKMPEKNKLIADYAGKRLRTKIFIERFIDINDTRRMYDANSDFLCIVNMVDAASFPSAKGLHEVEGIFVDFDGKPGLTRCKFVQRATR